MREISLIQLAVLILAVFRLTRLFMYDTITEFIRKPFLSITSEYNEEGELINFIEYKGSGLRRWIGMLLSCYWCVGIWSSMIIIGLFYFLPSFFPLILVLAVAGGSAILSTYIR